MESTNSGLEGSKAGGEGSEKDRDEYEDHLDELIKERTAQLRESELRYRTLFESANDAIFTMKGDRFTDCNNKTL